MNGFYHGTTHRIDLYHDGGDGGDVANAGRQVDTPMIAFPSMLPEDFPLESLPPSLQPPPPGGYTRIIGETTAYDWGWSHR
jgi:hypothetical protein